MNEEGRIDGLLPQEIEELQHQAAEKLGLCQKQNDVIGSQIFLILKRFARVIYYPLGKDAPWGFTRMSGTQSRIDTEKPFVAINTAISLECQVFAAAHELYHIWFDKEADIIPSTVLDDSYTDKHEQKANRFAAEFLAEENLLRREINLYSFNKEHQNEKEILILADLFVVPYRTMVKRLFEIGTITREERNDLLSKREEDIISLRNRYSIAMNDADKRISIDNLVELAANAYDRKLITYEKLEYLLGLTQLKPSDLGITPPVCTDFPSDDELDHIMEE